MHLPVHPVLARRRSRGPDGSFAEIQCFALQPSGPLRDRGCSRHRRLAGDSSPATARSTSELGVTGTG